MTRPRVLVEDWEEDGIHWFGVRFGYPVGEIVDPAEIVMNLKEALTRATTSH